MSLWLRLLLTAAILAAVGLAVHHYNEFQRDIGRKESDAKWTRAALQESEKRIAKESALNEANEGIDRELQQARLDRAAVDALNGQRLRDLNAALDAAKLTTHPTATGGTDAGTDNDGDDPRARIARECFGAVAALDRRTQELAGQTRGLQAYASDVCVAAGR